MLWFNYESLIPMLVVQIFRSSPIFPHVYVCDVRRCLVRGVWCVGALIGITVGRICAAIDVTFNIFTADESRVPLFHGIVYSCRVKLKEFRRNDNIRGAETFFTAFSSMVNNCFH